MQYDGLPSTPMKMAAIKNMTKTHKKKTETYTHNNEARLEFFTV